MARKIGGVRSEAKIFAAARFVAAGCRREQPSRAGQEACVRGATFAGEELHVARTLEQVMHESIDRCHRLYIRDRLKSVSRRAGVRPGVTSLDVSHMKTCTGAAARVVRILRRAK